MEMPEIETTNTDVLVVIDVQHDFLPGGALAVPKGGEVLHALAP